ncbi:Nuclear poly(A) polymerase [Seminavis robusta]|uniref:Poly(A) polymerase n=1 Tax=Seminavis robusta TaxID=568900 RepID=A0A9N8EZ25_9STRA|nr:Nuclear poly(A) polymerase [Seminavis robusta]|eukprot:Sro3009_g342060.1 Nuclear poly(A) polymerase (607) ;mRNA; f:4410-6230
MADQMQFQRPHPAHLPQNNSNNNTNRPQHPTRYNNNNNNNRTRRKGKYQNGPRQQHHRSQSPPTGPPTSLETTLRELACYDDANESRRRNALDVLEKILYQWSIDLLRADNHNNPWQRPRVAVITFGSYRLGVHRPSSDLDVLALSPPHCTRADFFLSLVDRLDHDQRVTDLHPIPTAYTPVIKFVLQGIQIDLLFARVENANKLFQYQQSQPSLLLRDDEEPIPRNPRIEYSIDNSDLVGQDEAGVRSINGSRVSQCMLSLVPDVNTFRLTLRAVKAWADIHGVQSNVLGFLGGINWAILVARVAMDNPEADAPQLLLLFFKTYSQWKWPEPVTLGEICTEPPPGVMPMAAWNPQVNPRDGLHLMPIITPVFPSMNSSYNIGIPQLRRIQDEMIRAAYALEHARSPGDCTALFRDGGFFRRHSNYLQVNIRARNAEDFLHWFRLCESKMRLLIACLETPEVHAWPFAKFFDRRFGTTHESYFFIALRFAEGVETVDLRYSTSEFLHKINSWEGRKEGMDLSIARVSANDLPSFVLGRATHNKKSNNHNSNNNSSSSNHHNNHHHNNNNNHNYHQQRNKPTINVGLCPRMVPEGGPMSPTKRAKLN